MKRPVRGDSETIATTENIELSGKIPAGSSDILQNDAGTNEKIDTPVTRASSQGVHDFTYFIRDGEAIKIGSSGAPRLRLQNLQTSNHRKLKLLAMVPAAMAGEYACHKRFDHLHIRGEWFRAEPELLSFIAELKGQAKSKLRRHRYFNVKDDVGRLMKLRDSFPVSSPIWNRLCIGIEQLRNWSTCDDYQTRLALVRLMKNTRSELAERGVAI